MTFQERYQYNPNTDLLGKGGFARVYKAKDILLDRDVAIKVFNATDKGQYTVIEEIKKAIKLQHPNLLRYYDVAVIDNTNALGESYTLQIGVMELANAGDLKNFARKNPQSPLLFKLLQQVLSGLEYLHSKGIIHRDLKPQNILLVEEDGELSCKISDFGISKSLDSGTNSSSMAIGTIEYMAPEQFSPGKYGINGKIGTNVDLWSFGIMVHELLTNEPLFGQRSGNTTAEQIMNAILSQTLPPDIETLPEPYKTVVKKCLVADARQRIQKAHELIGLLEGKEPQSSAAETQALDKSLLKKVNESSSAETVAIPKPKPVSEQKPVASAPPPPPQPPRKKKSNSVLYVTLLVLVAIGAAATWWFTRPQETEGQTEYRLAMENQASDTVYMYHMTRAAELGLDTARLKMAQFYFSKGAIAEMGPFLERLVTFNDGTYSSKFPDVLFYQVQYFINRGDAVNAAIVAQQCADAGDTRCAYEIGLMYYEGHGVSQDFDKALGYFNQAAEQQDDRAQTMLGNMYIMGQGVDQNNTLAIEYYYKAVNKNNEVAMYALGLAFMNGLGVTQNNDEARKWLQRVAENGKMPEVVQAAKTQLAEL